MKSRGHNKFKIFSLALSLAALLIFGQGGETAFSDTNSAGQYRQAKKFYYSLNHSKAKKSQRKNWLAVIDKFEKVLKKYPQTPEASKATFTIGRLYHRLGEALGNSADLEAASQRYRNLVEKFPPSRLSDDALIFLADIYLKQENYSGAPPHQLPGAVYHVSRTPSGRGPRAGS